MEKVCKYRYFIYKERLVARLVKGCSELDVKEFYINGEWVHDENLNQGLNDCIMDYGDSRWYEYEEVSEETALEFITNIGLGD